MITTRAFLELLVPSVGIIFTATPAPTQGWINVAHKSLDSAVQHVNKLTFEGKPAYFAMAGYDKERYWDETKQKWRSRTQANARHIKSFYLDMDVDPADDNKFNTKEHALLELRAFVKKVGLPRPMLIDSGGGLHAYWPLAMPILTEEWKPIAEKLKAICMHENFHADRTITSDQARVLRALGSYNVRRNAPVRLLSEAKPVGFADFAARVNDYAGQYNITTVVSNSAAPIAGTPAGAWNGENNLGATNDPHNFDRIVFGCPQLQLQAGTRGRDTGEQLWRAGLGVVKFCEPQDRAIALISDGHPEFNPHAAQQKIINWSTGPTTCSHFHQLQPSVCEACPHWQSITSPAQLGRYVAPAPAPEVVIETPEGPPITLTLPNPPVGYSRRSDGAVVRETEDSEQRPIYEVICPYDLYPLAIRSQNGIDANVDEHSTWRVHLPLKRDEGPTARDFVLPLGLLADSRGLSKLLFSKGIVLAGDQPKLTQMYMSAYLQKLAKEAGRDKLFERLGWHDEHHTFVMGDRVLHSDGTSTPHVASESIRAATKSGLRSAGTLKGWQETMAFYNKPGYEGHRFFIYASLAAPLFHMNDTGNRGALVCAGGASGRGKTTCLKACSSVWGTPDGLVVNGNREGATTNALYNTLGTLHSYPFILDDITERDNDELRRMALNISQGEGKRRMQADGTMTGRLDTWANLTLTSTNADTFTNLMAGGKDVDPHLMRIVAVEFKLVDTSAQAKIMADHFLRSLGQHFGHAGPMFMNYVVKHYDAIRKLYIRNVEKVDRLLASSNASAERYWSAVIAAAYTAGQIASKAGILDYPYESDLKWMISLLTKQRESIRESAATPLETLTTFLNGYLRNTLVISAKSVAATNLDNVVQKPVDDLLIRHELDRNVIYVARNALMDYCATSRTSFRTLEFALETDGVIIKRNAQKVLGADTIYSKGQTRCWQIDATKLGGYVAPSPAPAATAGQKVVAIGSKAA